MPPCTTTTVSSLPRTFEVNPCASECHQFYMDVYRCMHQRVFGSGDLLCLSTTMDLVFEYELN